MKIAFIGQKGIPAEQGGIENHVQNLALTLKDRGHEIFVYSRSNYPGNKKRSFSGITRIILPSIPTKNLEAISHTFLASLDVLRKDYDVVHYHGVGPSLLSFVPRIFKRNTKVVATFHCRDQFHKKWGVVARAMLSLGERAINTFPHETIVVSNILKEYSKDVYGRDAVYIPNGCAVNPTQKDSYLKEIGVKRGGYILAVSRLVRHKGIHYLIDAYNKLDTDLKLVITGDASYTDEYVTELKEQAAGNPNIIFTGMLKGEALGQIFINAQLFVHPSEAEGLPINVLEALRYGLPTIVSNIPENIEASGGYVYLFKNSDSEDLLEKMNLVLGRMDVAQNIASLGQRFVREKYDWRSISEAIENVYEQAVYKDIRSTSLSPVSK